MFLKFLLLCCIGAVCTLPDLNVCNSNTSCDFNQVENYSNTKESLFVLSGTTYVAQTEHNDYNILSNLNIQKSSVTDCPELEDADSLSQTQLINRLTAPCRYDRLERPTVLREDGSLAAVDVYARTFIYVMKSLETNALQLQMHGLLQFRYVDDRLAFGKYAPRRQKPLIGGAELRALIWVPHVIFSNEHDSSVLGTDAKDILTFIYADGTVVISSRIKATLYCWMDLRKFPFDEQYCSTIMESWTYNTTELILHWEKELPTSFEPNLHLTEYSLINAWCNESHENGVDNNDMRPGVFAGNYSALNFTVHLLRRSTDYILDYFIPSIIIVAVSWVSFWLDGSQSSPRTTLNTSTMLSFITLSLTQDNNLPKVSYIKVSEIWFLSCILFIFASLIEFAFVNTILRRKRHVQLKKVNSKHILKSTVVPRDKRFGNLSRSTSSMNSMEHIPDGVVSSEMVEKQARQTWATMAPEEVALWIDRKSRIFFPLAFLVFNIIFWILVYCL